MSATVDVPARNPWLLFTISGALSAVAGVLTLVWPDISLLTLALIAGINLMFTSAFLVGEAIADHERDDRTLRIIVGVLGLIAGLVVIRRPGETLLAVLLILGVWLVLSGVLELVRGVLVAGPHRAMRILGGLVDVVLGVLILALPKVSLTTLAILVGISFVIHGLTWVVLGLRLRRLGPRLS